MPQLHTYSLLLAEDGKGQQRRIEFDAPDAGRAIHLAHQLAPERAVEVRQGTQSLGSIKHVQQGFWVLSPAPQDRLSPDCPANDRTSSRQSPSGERAV